ncbi:enoyl-CoA hydratase/isomerase family protein [Peribacillus sp. NPDC097225]|uniref:enoyl-CoA hydratase/isomerase family protein n=1 Tax=Peribacillus sp. NPDC097225 TaxID=3364400 RepID=UPI0038217DB6
MSNYQTITYEETEQVALIRLNMPEMRNPLSMEMCKELVQAIRFADDKEDIRSILLTGTGKAFSAGADIRGFQGNLTKSAPQLYEEGIESTGLFKLGSTVKTPIIAAVNGAALGGGAGLVAMSHLAVASDKAKIGLTELKLGIVPFVIMPLVRRAVGDRKLLEMMLTANTYTALEAKDLQLVHKVVPHDQLEEEAWKLAKQVASYSPLAVRLSLEAFYLTEQVDLPKSMDLLSMMRIVSFQSEDLKEGAMAFIEKRSPIWTGR